MNDVCRHDRSEINLGWQVMLAILVIGSVRDLDFDRNGLSEVFSTSDRARSPHICHHQSDRSVELAVFQYQRFVGTFSLERPFAFYRLNVKSE